MLCVSVVFFKQKTAYEMRISDWSSDVCSSDLKKKAVALTARAQPAQEHRGCDFARLDRDGDLQEVLPVGLDQRPVDRAMKERIDMRISCLLVGAEKIEVLPVANPGQQVDTEQVRERKHRSRLALRVRIHGVRFDRKLGLHQAFDDIDGLPDTGRDKVPKCGDGVIREMSVGHGTQLAVPEVIAGQKVLIDRKRVV